MCKTASFQLAKIRCMTIIYAYQYRIVVCTGQKMEKGTNEERDYEPVTRATRVPLSSNDYLLCICDGHCEDYTLLKFPFFLSSCCSRITACISSGEVLKTNVTLCPSVNANELCTLRHLCPLADKPSNFKLTSGA